MVNTAVASGNKATLAGRNGRSRKTGVFDVHHVYDNAVAAWALRPPPDLPLRVRPPEGGMRKLGSGPAFPHEP